jgi:hypothetical protein
MKKLALGLASAGAFTALTLGLATRFCVTRRRHPRRRVLDADRQHYLSPGQLLGTRQPQRDRCQRELVLNERTLSARARVFVGDTP